MSEISATGGTGAPELAASSMETRKQTAAVAAGVAVLEKTLDAQGAAVAELLKQMGVGTQVDVNA